MAEKNKTIRELTEQDLINIKVSDLLRYGGASEKQVELALQLQNAMTKEPRDEKLINAINMKMCELEQALKASTEARPQGKGKGDKNSKEASTQENSALPNTAKSVNGEVISNGLDVDDIRNYGTVLDGKGGLNWGSTFNLGAARPNQIVRKPKAKDVVTGQEVKSELSTYEQLEEQKRKDAENQSKTNQR